MVNKTPTLNPDSQSGKNILSGADFPNNTQLGGISNTGHRTSEGIAAPNFLFSAQLPFFLPVSLLFLDVVGCRIQSADYIISLTYLPAIS